MHSHHSHSGQFCQHAAGTLEEVVREAIRQGFQVFGLTEHVPRYREQDLYPEEAGTALEDLANQFESFLDEATRLKSVYAAQITLLIGLETEHITPLDLARLERILNGSHGRIEYMVGSVHHVNGLPIDFDLSTFKKSLHFIHYETEHQAVENLLCKYFQAQYELLQQFHPEVIGHFDLCRMWIPELKLQDYPAAWDLVQRNVTYAVGYNALFELNAAAFRKGWDTAYPGPDVVELILKHEGRFALSDDSHGPHAVGLNYHRLLAYAKKANISDIWYLQSSSVPNVAGRYIQPTKFTGNWQDHTFWEGRAIGIP